jgi:hypothetical protein
MNYAAIPEFGQLTEYITQGPLVDDVYTTVINRVPLDAIITPSGMDGQTTDNLLSLQAIKADYAMVNAINPVRVPELNTTELTPVKTAIAVNHYSDVVRYTTDTTPTGLVITTKLVEVVERPDWKVGLAVTIGQVYQYTVDKNLYQVIQAHTTQSDYMPPICHSLFKRFYEPTDAPWPWVQPQGAHDAYPIGARVTDGGYTWQSTIAANVWRPGSVGAETLWTNLTPPPPNPNWTYPVAYKINDLVKYVPDGFNYKCRQSHTSQAGWYPPAVPALWLKI